MQRAQRAMHRAGGRSRPSTSKPNPLLSPSRARRPDNRPAKPCPAFKLPRAPHESNPLNAPHHETTAFTRIGCRLSQRPVLGGRSGWPALVPAGEPVSARAAAPISLARRGLRLLPHSLQPAGAPAGCRRERKAYEKSCGPAASRGLGHQRCCGRGPAAALLWARTRCSAGRARPVT